MRRALLIGVAVLAVVGTGVFLAGLGGAGTRRVVTVADSACQESNNLILQAQSVPTAQLIPCITEAAEGWVVVDEQYGSDGSSVQLGTGDANGARWTVMLEATCSPAADAQPRSYPDQGGRYQVVGTERSDGDTATDTEWYTFAGGCVTSSVAIPSRFDTQRIFDELDQGFVFAPRSAVDQLVVDKSDGRLTLDPPGTAP